MVDALVREIELRKDELGGAALETIYFGGGTPSVLATSDIERLVAAVYANHKIIESPEITLEANPDDLTPEKIQQFADSPINRLSIGVQSFFEQDLKLMNRAHNAEEAVRCLELSIKSFKNLSIDLIYGMPDMDNARWRKNLEQAFALDIPHISSYALTVEPRTPLHKFVKDGIVTMPEEEKVEEHFRILLEAMEKAGYENYEFSNFGKPGFLSRNNTAYWLGKPYIGIGPSAHGFNGERRSWNVRNNAKYLKTIQNGKLPQETEILTTTDKYNEYVMTGLRTKWGASLLKIERDFGKKYREYALQQAQKHLENHLLFFDGDTLLVTKKGKFLSDGLAADLFLVNLA